LSCNKIAYDSKAHAKQVLNSTNRGNRGMSIRNKVLVKIYLEDGCKQEDDEVSICWVPVNFLVYSNLFQELIDNAVDDWLSENKLCHGYLHELILAHEVERDGGGAITGESFEIIHHEAQEL